MSSKRDLDDFTSAYIEAALWSSTDNADEQGGEPLDKNYGPENIAPPTMRAMQRDCATFVERYGNLVEGDDPKSRGGHDRWGMAGHDFWLSRNGHGAGFFDGDWPMNGDELQTAAESYGSFELYVGDDGVIYGAGAEEDPPGVANEHRDTRTGRFAPGPGPGPDPAGEWAVVQRQMKVYAKQAGLGDYVHNSAIPAGDGTWRFWAQRPGERSKEHRVTMQALKNAYDRGGLSERRVATGHHRHAAPHRRHAAPLRRGTGVRDYDVVDNRGKRLAGPFKDYGQARSEADRQGGVVGFIAGERQSRSAGCPVHGVQEGANGNRWDYYSVEGEPGTWTIHDRLTDAIAQAKALGVSQVWGVKHTWHKSGQSGVDKRVVWVANSGMHDHEVAAPRSQHGYRAEASRRQLPRVEWNQQQEGNAHVSDGQEGYWATFPQGTSAKKVLDVYMSTADYSAGTGTFTVTAKIGGDVASVRVGPGGEVVGERHRGGYRAEMSRRGRPAPSHSRGRRARDYSVLSRHGSKMMEKSSRGRSVKEVDAEAAGYRYAEEQLNGDHFKDWVWEQMVEGCRMRKADPKSVIPLENAADFKKLARNMLQQLGWDMDRDLDMRTILETVGVDSEGSSQDAEVARDFGRGVRAMLTKPGTIQWLASECRTIEQDLKRKEREAGGGRKGKASEPAQTVRLLPPARR